MNCTCVKRSLLAVGISVSLSGCFSTAPQDEPKVSLVERQVTINELAFEPVRVEPDSLKPASLEEVRAGYRELITQVDDENTLSDMAYRAADLDMLLAEKAQEQGQPNEQDGYYQTAIEAYLTLLSQYPEANNNELVLYQLSRAYDLQGQGELAVATLQRLLAQFPTSVYGQESHFRMGEHFYSQGNYVSASQAYKQALKSGVSGFYVTSAYMLGWSELKQEAYSSSLNAFSTMLDASLANVSLNSVDGPLAQLGKGERKQVKDTLRVMALLFSYQGNGEAIIDFYADYGTRDYVYLVFDELAQQHLDDDRFSDSADVYLSFAEWQPQHPMATDFYIKHIDAYVLGDFPTLVLPAKQGFVETYGINGPYYQKWRDERQNSVRPYLNDYLTSLAQSEHSLAQTLTARSDTEQDAELAGIAAQQARQAFLNAARWYQEYIDTFDNDTAVQMRYYLADALHDAGRFAEAIAAYERFAYQYPDHKDAPDAAYNALLTYAPLIDASPEQDWQQKRQLSREAFVKTFMQDPRAIDVAEVMMQSYFDGQDFAAASHWAQWLLAQFSEIAEPLPDSSRVTGAQLVLSHSQFALEQFAEAEQGYRELLAGLTQDDGRVADLRERLAASLYKQAEQALGREDKSLAVTLLGTILRDVPDSTIRLAAQYDLATYQLQLGAYSEAINQLVDFSARFPEHEYVADIPEKLLFAYEQSENWLPAAELLEQRWQQQPDSEPGQEALYLAADYYQRGGQTDTARLTLRTYAHRYPQPFDLAVEARYRMSEFYVASGEDSKRRFWLNKLIEIDRDAGEQRSARSRYLAAMSALVFADDARVNYTQIKLTLPLKSSLANKRKAMQEAIARYQRVADYGVAAFSTAATYQLGEIYRSLAIDLMDSSRPQGLTALELAQYDMLLEEQAFPFEEQAIDLHELNTQRSWQGLYDEWVKQSFDQLAQLLPARYNKQEKFEELSL